MSTVTSDKYLYISVLIVDIAAFLCGVSLAWSSPTLAALENDNNPLKRKITEDEESWIGSLSALGGILGPPIFAYLNQKFGRKRANILLGVPYLMSYLTAAFAQTTSLFYVSRMLMGIGIGGVLAITTVYIAELSQTNNRGFLCSSVTIFLAVGILISNSVGAYTSIITFNLILSGICVLFIVLLACVAPESPYYLVGKNKEKQALDSLCYLRGNSDAHCRKELEEIKIFLERLESGSVLDVFGTRASRKALLYSVVLTSFQQFCGINVILFFTEDIFSATGSKLSPEISSIIVASVQLVCSFATPLGVNRIGRKGLLYKVSIPGCILAEFLLGSYFFMKNNNYDVSHMGWLPVTALVLFIAFYNFGVGSLPWVILSEILPTNVVSSGAAMITSFYWFTGFLLTRYFEDLNDAIGMTGSFWMFAGFDILFWLFVFYVMFETNGKSLNEIQEILNAK